MKSKGARLTTEISLPGRFVVFVPSGEGLGVSRRLEDDERVRLRDIVKAIAPKKGGVIVRTAAEGASAEDIERDLVFLQRLWKSVETKAETAKAPALVYQEAELPLRVTRDLFTDDFEKALIDDEKTYKRIVGYLKKTSPHMVDRVIRHREKTPLFEATGVDDAIRSTLSRRVDLPSGGYLVFDYAEAFTVIDVNTGRFVGSRSKSSGGRLEDTITANNLEAVKEVVHQLRLRDIGGIIVIDFIDMANPKNRATVEEALKTELERDRTKTYVVEISPLGLVEMTRQNVTDGPREILTQKCTTCGGDGIVLSAHSAAIDMERKLRDLAKNSKRGVEAYRIELEEDVAAHLIGPGALRLIEIETLAKRRFFLEGKAGVPLDHFKVRKRRQARGHRARSRRSRKARRSGSSSSRSASTTCLRPSGSSTGCRSSSRTRPISWARRRRFASSASWTAAATRRSSSPRRRRTTSRSPPRPRPRSRPARRARRRRRSRARSRRQRSPSWKRRRSPRNRLPRSRSRRRPSPSPTEGEEPPKPKKKTRRGSRGGRNRKKKPAAAAAAENGKPDEPPVAKNGRPAEAPAGATIHVPSPDLGQAADGETAADPDAPPKKKRTRRGSRGGRNRRKKPTAATAETSQDPPPE